MAASDVRPADTLIIDRLLNRGFDAAETTRIANAVLESPMPEAYVSARVLERAKLAKIAASLPPGVEQRTPEWYAARDQIVSASDFYQAAFGTDAAKRAFVAKKAGTAAPFLGNDATRWGVKYEDVAKLLYEKVMGTHVVEHGLLMHPTEAIVGASPDGITSYCNIEIKNPASKVLADVPNEYFAQMQGQMEVCGINCCDFVVCRQKEFPDAPEFWDKFASAFDLGYGHDRYGAVGSKQREDSDALTFVYSDPGMSPDELREWTAGHPDYSFTLHHVFDFRITRVNRDGDYIAKMIVGLKETWARVLEARANPKALASAKRSAGNDYVEPPTLRGFSFRQPR